MSFELGFFAKCEIADGGWTSLGSIGCCVRVLIPATSFSAILGEFGGGLQSVEGRVASVGIGGACVVAGDCATDALRQIHSDKERIICFGTLKSPPPQTTLMPWRYAR